MGSQHSGTRSQQGEPHPPPMSPNASRLAAHNAPIDSAGQAEALCFHPSLFCVHIDLSKVESSWRAQPDVQPGSLPHS